MGSRTTVSADWSRTTALDEVKRRTDGLSVFLVDLRENLGRGVAIRPISTNLILVYIGQHVLGMPRSY